MPRSRSRSPQRKRQRSRSRSRSRDRKQPPPPPPPPPPPFVPAPNVYVPASFLSLNQQILHLKLCMAELEYKRNKLEKRLHNKIGIADHADVQEYTFNDVKRLYKENEVVWFITDAEKGVQHGRIVGHIDHTPEWIVDDDKSSKPLIVHARYFVTDRYDDLYYNANDGDESDS